MTDYICVSLRPETCSQDICDLLAADLAEVGFDSFETSDESLDAYIPASDFSEDTVNSVIAGFLMPVHIEWNSHPVKGEDWNAEWERNSFTPIVISGRCVVHSTLHTDVPAAEYDIKINPRLSFGSGHHTTTRLIIGYLLDYKELIRGKRLIDVGTGTGILSIMAALLGASQVTAIEIDRAAYENALENFELNGVDISLIHSDASALRQIESDADILLANINRNVVIADLPLYASTLRPGATMILSGFYTSDIEMVKDAAAKQGLILSESRTEPGENWVAILLEKH